MLMGILQAFHVDVMYSCIYIHVHVHCIYMQSSIAILYMIKINVYIKNTLAGLQCSYMCTQRIVVYYSVCSTYVITSLDFTEMCRRILQFS